MQLSDSILNENNPLGSSRLSKLRQIFKEGKSLQLQLPAEDLGFRYSKGALISYDNLSGTTEAPTGVGGIMYPPQILDQDCHMKIQLLSESISKDSFSTLDLVSGDDIEFLLIISPFKSSHHLAQAAFKVAEEFKVPIKVCVIWQEKTTNGIGRNETEHPWKSFIDMIEVKTSPTSPSWWDLCRMTDKGAILVRPDEHIAWRSKMGIENEPFRS